MRLRALAPAKINLGLILGPVRQPDGRHELASVMQSVSLADELTLEPAPAGSGRDEVICPGVEGENLAGAALTTFRAATGWAGPPVRLIIDKRIPVAAGLGGGSADAAAALRLARAASGLGDDELLVRLAGELGADVPAQVAPGRWLATGAGEALQALAPPAWPFGVLILPVAAALSTAQVYGEADRLGLARDRAELASCAAGMLSELGGGTPLPADSALLENDLQTAAISLCPQIEQALEEARSTGAEHVLVSGSGPTVLALFGGRAGRGREGPARAHRAAEALGERVPAPLAAEPVLAPYGAPGPLPQDPDARSARL